MKKNLMVFAMGVLAAAVMASPVVAQIEPPPIDPNDDPRHNCRCDNSPSEVCSLLGYKISLVNFGIDQAAGTSIWDYQLCNEAGMGTGCEPVNASPFEHVDIALPLLGTCMTETQLVEISQVGGFDQAQLTCAVDSTDPVCGIIALPGYDYLNRCSIVPPSELTGGECVEIRITIAGEMPTLGAGAAVLFTKDQSNPDCERDCLEGPACIACDVPPPPPGDECLTRSKGFWGNHPHITGLFRPIEVCGQVLDKVEAGTCDSITEALCVAPGKEMRKGNKAYANLVKQMAAAKLNIAASVAYGGGCGEAILARIAECEALCGASAKVINNSGCIRDLTNFNKSKDTVLMTPVPFDHPRPANPDFCQEANGNGLVIGVRECASTEL